MTKLPFEFFNRPPQEVAQELLGRTLHVLTPEGKQRKVQLKEVAAYEGVTKTTSKGILYFPGTVSISRKFRSHLIDITTGRNHQPTCVTIRGALSLEEEVEELKGPGVVAKFLGIDNHPIFYEGVSCPSKFFYVDGKPADQSQILKLPGNSANCIGFYQWKV